MTVIRYSDKIMEKAGEAIFANIDTSFFWSFVYYIINSKYNKSVKLVDWLKEQVDNPSEKLKDIAKEIPDNEDYDIQIIEILKYIEDKLTYSGDITEWKMLEHWNTVEETITTWKGDCEDGAILIYVLGRLKGIPANRMHICAGNVEDGGHAWIGYKPKNYPLNFSFIDWCYWYDSNIMGYRNKFSIIYKNITEYTHGTKISVLSKYFDIWFMFNEEKSYPQLKPTIMR